MPVAGSANASAPGFGADAGASVTPRAPGNWTFLSIEIGAALDAAGHFPGDESGRNVVEAVDSTLGAGAWLGSRQMAFGLAFERSGLGKDHYGADPNGQVLNASYDVDTVWIGARGYFSETRPAFYLSGQVGPSLPEVRATGTRTAALPLSAPPTPFQCSDSGRVGIGFAAAAGAEFDMSEDFSLLAEAKVGAHVLGTSQSGFGGCAPGPGPSVSGALGLRLAYRFGF
jgi:hypothetical protein